MNQSNTHDSRSPGGAQGVDLAVAALARGDLTLLKGDIGYGLLGSCEQAIRKMYVAKGRPLSNPCIVIGNRDILNDVAIVPPGPIAAWIDATTHWTTLAVVLPVNTESRLLRGLSPWLHRQTVTNGTIAIFLNVGPFLEQVIAKASERGLLVVGSSANPSSHGNIYSFDEIPQRLRDAADFSMNHGRCKYENHDRKATTIVNFSNWTVKRRGVNWESIEPSFLALAPPTRNFPPPHGTTTMNSNATTKQTFDFKQFDADSHVQEVGGSWERYLCDEFAHRRPQVTDNPHVSLRPERNKTWYIDGRLVPKNQGAGGVVMSTPAEMEFARRKPVPLDVQACTNPKLRAAMMKEWGIDRTVLFSTLFLETLTDDLVYEAALMRAWNDWIADACKEAPEVLRFAALVPLRDPALAIAEMRRATGKGAATVMVLPTAGERHLHDPILDPFWAEAQNLGVPVSVHIGWPNPRQTLECTTPSSIFLGAFDLSVWWAYLSIFTGGVLDRFPRLKVSFVEHDARFFKLFLERAMHWYPTAVCKPWPAKKSPDAYLREGRVYFVYEGDYAYLPDFMKLVGEDNVMGGVDFPHTHYGVASLSASFDFLRDHAALSPLQKRKILHDNAAAFYGFKD